MRKQLHRMCVGQLQALIEQTQARIAGAREIITAACTTLGERNRAKPPKVSGAVPV
jgi:hypothetical protein